MVEQSGTDGPEQASGARESEAKEIRELLSIASHERKNLQLLVEYFE